MAAAAPMDDPSVFRHTAALLSTPRRRDLIFSGQFGWLGDESLEFSVTGKTRSSEPGSPGPPARSAPAGAARCGNPWLSDHGRSHALAGRSGADARGLPQPGDDASEERGQEHSATLQAQRRRLRDLKKKVARQRQVVEAEAVRLEASLNSMLAPYWRRGDNDAEEYVLKVEADPLRSGSSPAASAASGEGSTALAAGGPLHQSLRPLSAASARVLRPPSPPSALERTVVLIRPALDPATLARARTEEAARRRRLLRVGAAILDEEAAMGQAGAAGSGRRLRMQQEAGNGLQALTELRRARLAPSGAATGSLRTAQFALRAVVARAKALLLDQSAGMGLDDAEHLAAAKIAGEPGLTPHEQLAAGVASSLAEEWKKILDASALQERAGCT